MDVRAYIPVAVIGVVLWALHRSGANSFHLAVALIAGVVLAGTVAGPAISGLLSLVSGGHLH